MSDFDRGLNSRGTKDIVNIARCMFERGYLPDQTYASPSNRTRTTIEEIKRNIKGFDLSNGNRSDPNTELPIEYVDSLYSGSLGSYLNVLKSHENNNSSLMLVGHNPTCHALADSLIGDGTAKALALISFKYPTGALAVIDVDAGKWVDIGDKSGYLRDFVLPRELQAI
jgi:phosphohistidine phosphatase